MNANGRKNGSVRIPLCLLFTSIILYLFVQSAVAEDAPSVRFLINDAETVNLWADESGDAYVFLPSFADTDSTVISIEDGCAVTIDGVPVESGTDCASYEIGRSYPLGIEGAAPKSLTFLRSDNVAALFVTTKRAIWTR